MSSQADTRSRSARAETPPPGPPLEEVAERLSAAVERSPADETEIVWMELRSGRAVHAAAERDPDRADAAPAEGGTGASTTVQVRVRERERIGFHRTGGPQGPGRATGGFGGLDAAVRLALGQARLSPAGPPLPLAGPGGRRDLPPIHDPAVASLVPAVAADLLASGAGPRDRLVLEWHELRLVVANSRGTTRSAAATSLTLAARHGAGPGAGYARGSARSLAGLEAPEIVQRATDRSAGGGPVDRLVADKVAADEVDADELPADRPVLLSPEAVAALVCCFADAALTSRAFLDRTSWLAGRLDQPVCHRAVTLVDDATDPAGLPFPFDADGWPKRPVTLVEDGVLLSPAIDAELGRELGRTPTPHAVAFDESRAGNLFLGSGQSTADDLLRAADGGLWIAALDGLRCTDPLAGTFRAFARGVRRIRDGGLGAPLPDLEWHGDLGRILEEPLAVGDEPRLLASHGAWGGTRAPALVLPDGEGLRPSG